MVKVNWSSDNCQLFFRDLEINQAFRNAGKWSKGAIYIKVGIDKTSVSQEPFYYMYEVATGKLWPATSSPVEVVDVSVNINSPKPAAYTEDLL